MNENFVRHKLGYWCGVVRQRGINFIHGDDGAVI